MRVAIGGIIHDRPTLAQHLDSMRALEVGDVSPVWMWVVDGPGVMEPLMRRFPDAVVAHVPRFPDLPHYACKETYIINGQEVGKLEAHRRLAMLRAMLSEMVLAAGADFLLSVDSDIVLPPDLFSRLLACGKPWVSGLVRNSAVDGTIWNVFHLRDRQRGSIRHFRPTWRDPQGRTIPSEEGVGWDPRDVQRTEDLIVGAVCLYSRALLRTVRWREHRLGEDIAFGIDAHAAGFRGWYLPIVCEHLGLEERRL